MSMAHSSIQLYLTTNKICSCFSKHVLKGLVYVGLDMGYCGHMYSSHMCVLIKYNIMQTGNRLFLIVFEIMYNHIVYCILYNIKCITV